MVCNEQLCMYVISELEIANDAISVESRLQSEVNNRQIFRVEWKAMQVKKNCSISF